MSGRNRREPLGGRVPLDDLLRALAAERRRRVIRYFLSAEGDVATVDELAEHAAQAGRSDQRRAETDLVHATLPQLADVGLVEFDRRSHTVRYRGRPAAERVLSAVAAARNRA